MCSYMNGCSSSGECNQVTGKCKCYGRLGADCSETWNSLPLNGTFEVDGINWIMFLYTQIQSDTDDFEFTLACSNPMDIYIQGHEGVEANEFNHTIEVKKQTRFTLRSASLPSHLNFTASVRINGANLYENKFFTSKVQVTFVKIPKASTSPSYYALEGQTSTEN